MKKMALITLIELFLLALPLRAQINLLHEFAGGGGNGRHPYGSLIISGTTLYGMTSEGGDSDDGAIFKIQSDGTGFITLHSFAGGAADGEYPTGSLILSGSTLYSMTVAGGNSDLGTIFKIETDGSGFILLHEFAGGIVDGRNPVGSLILSGSTLYGVASGGDIETSKIFKLETDGTDFTLMHEFTGGADNVVYSTTTLILSGSTLYGMTNTGGSSDLGTIFKIETDGSDFTLLHEFAGGISDGNDPFGSLIISGSTLYGMTCRGGDVGRGTIFRIETNGTDFSLLHKFIYSATDGIGPVGSLLLSGSILYGMTQYGGDNDPDIGTIFKIQTDGSGFSLLHSFVGGADDGAEPYGSLIISESTLYGMTYEGGDGGDGVVFSLTLPPSITVDSPNGGENWNSGDVHNITWSSIGTIANVNIDYSTNSGSSWSSLAANANNDGTYAWTVPAITPSANCFVRVSDTSNAAINDVSNNVFSISQSAAETVSTPSQPAGAASGLKDTSYSFSTGGSTSNLDDAVQYKFDWDDGTDSGWLAAGTTQAAHSWAAAGTYAVRAMARCASDTAIESPWSSTYPVIITDGGTTGHYNSPAQYKVLPEVIWSSATGGGTWMSNVQVTDVSGGSQVSVYYNAASGRRGPFLLWDNSAGGALSSVKYTNLLQTIDGLDSGAFTYYGTVGAVEFISQD
ncbi:MAG: hypothetical protein L6455_02845, partial [Kiritimatiellae bacterium]|nr:hypothetical protein [Kiritimatiellia bacterium]